MTIFRKTIVLSGLFLMVSGSFLLAHPDDPKGLVKRIPYVGPGYRSADPKLDAEYQNVTAGAPSDFPSSGIRLMAWLPVGEFGESSAANDCWGYVSPSGREYAILGLRSGTGFADITQPGNPIVLGMIGGSPSSWRDIKVFGQYAYSVTEGFGGGIQVIDLTQIDSGLVTLSNEVFEDIDDPFLATGSSHNIAIDEDSGYLYRCGGGSNGLRIYSLADPANPTYVGAWSDRYIHDAQIVTYTDGPYAGRQIAFCCSGFNGGSVETGLDILDVTDKDNIINLSRLIYTDGRYSHQAWLSDDRRYLYLNDEGDETGLGIPTQTIVFDVQDIENPFEATTFTNGSAAIGHNLYVKGNLIYEANYRSGMRVFDATDPLSPFEVAYFDTYPDDDRAAFNGMWSVFPFFPSGTVIASDIERGLFVFRGEDCNGNNIVDADEIAADPSLDCNLNSVLDECDIAEGTSSDGNQDGVPDECTDCNANGQSDIIDLAQGLSEDCNANGVPDECDPDCNANGIVDECEIKYFTISTGEFSPIGDGVSYTLTIPDSPAITEGDVMLTFRGRGDFEGGTKFITLIINGFGIHQSFKTEGGNCSTEPDTDSTILSNGTFRFLRDLDPNKDLNIQFVATSSVDASACEGESFYSMEMTYQADTGLDENDNGVPDECDPPICQEREATVYVDLFGMIVGGHFDGLPYFGILMGTHGDDVIVGTDGRDVIIGLKGDDVICGLGGNDIINGNHGDDSIDGGDGFDNVHGNGGTDSCVNGERVAGCEDGSNQGSRRVLRRKIRAMRAR
ncbi:MAG: choice-of-anchor B family protein [Planctomycetota bacterium]|nr:choice-of-anchor B family protein [Planctomycetota bacterium]